MKEEVVVCAINYIYVQYIWLIMLGNCSFRPLLLSEDCHGNGSLRSCFEE